MPSTPHTAPYHFPEPQTRAHSHSLSLTKRAVVSRRRLSATRQLPIKPVSIGAVSDTSEMPMLSSPILNPQQNPPSIAIVGRIADPFATENWDEDYDWSGYSAVQTGTLRFSSRFIQQSNQSTNHSNANIDTPKHIHQNQHSNHDSIVNDNEEEDWDAEIDAEITLKARSISTEQTSQLKPIIIQPIVVVNHHDNDDEDWDAEIAAETRSIPTIRHPHHISQTHLQLPTLTVDDDEDWSDINDDFRLTTLSPSQQSTNQSIDKSSNQSIKQSNTRTSSERPLKSMLHAMLGLDDDVNESYECDSPIVHETSDLPSERSLLTIIAAPSSEQRVNIVTYPAPSSLYSLTTEDGRRELTEKQLETWLKDCVTKHTIITRFNARSESISRPGIKSNNKTRRLFDERLFNEPLATSSSIRVDEVAPSALLQRETSLPSVISSPSLSSTNQSNNQTSNQLNNEPVSGTLPAILPELLLHLSYIYHNQSISQSAKHSSNAFVNEGWQLICKLFDFIEARVHLPSLSECFDDELTYLHLHSILFIAAKWWTPARSTRFTNLLSVAKLLLPSWNGELELLELEAQAHHEAGRANALIRGFVYLYRKHSLAITSNPTRHSYECAAQALTSLSFYLTSCSPLNTSPLSEEAQWDAEKVEFAWLDFAWNGDEPESDNEMQGHTREIEMLTWQLCGPPAYRITLIAELYPHLRPFSNIKARCAYILGHFALVHGEEAIAAIVQSADPNVASPSLPSFPSSGGTSISVDRNEHHSTRLAEKLLFECVYILDKIPIMPAKFGSNMSPLMSPIASPRQTKQSPSTNDSNVLHRASLNQPMTSPQYEPYVDSTLGPSIVPILSDLGTTALMLYGDCLLALSKYQFAILSFESAAASYRWRKGHEFHALNKKLCEICPKHDDIDRSIRYHKRIADQAMSDGNLNMYVYIVQELSRLHQLQGHSAKAEENLRKALSFMQQFMSSSSSKPGANQTLNPNTFAQNLQPTHHAHSASVAGQSGSLANRMRPHLHIDISHSKFLSIAPSEFRSASLNIYLQLARLYLDSDRVSHACTLLEALVNTELPRSKVGVVNLLLAQTYVKRRRFRKAERILKFMEGSTSQQGNGTSGQPNRRVVQGLSLAGSDILNSLDYLIVRTKTYYHSGDYANALYWLDIAMSSCSASSLAMLARLHYRKGKIYQAALFASMAPSSQQSGDMNFFPPPLAPPLVVNRCVMPDPRKAVTSLYDAYHFYESIDDQARQVKCLARITDIYCHIAFTPIALMATTGPSTDVSLNDLIPWLQLADFDCTVPEIAFNQFLEQINELASQTLDYALESLKLLDSISAYLSMAELRFMQGRAAVADGSKSSRSAANRFTKACQTYWQAAKDAFFTLFVAGSQTILGRKSTPGFVRKVSFVLKRIVRLLMLMRGRFINQNLQVLDVWILYEQEMQADLRRAAELDEEEINNEQKSPEGPVINHSLLHTKFAESNQTGAKRAQTLNQSSFSINATATFPDFALTLEPLSPLMDEIPASPLSPVSPRTHSRPIHQSIGRMARPTWSDHRTAAWGALGSRSKHAPSSTGSGAASALSSDHQQAQLAVSVVNHSLTLSRYASDSPMAQRIRVLSERVCHLLQEMVRNGDQHAAGKLTMKQLFEANSQSINRIKETTAQVRLIIQLNDEENVGTDSDVSPSLNIALNQTLHSPSNDAATYHPSKSSQLAAHLHSRLTHWLPSAHTLSDPMYPNLMYAFALDSLFFMYSPKHHHRLVRLMTTNHPFHPTPSSSPTSSPRPPPLPVPHSPLASPANTQSPGRVQSFNFNLTMVPFIDRMLKDFHSTRHKIPSHYRSPDTFITQAPPPPKSKSASNSATPRAAARSVAEITRKPLGSQSTYVPTKVGSLPESRDHSDFNLSIQATLPSSSSMSSSTNPNGVSSSDACAVCSCEWYAVHPFTGPVCRNCFHDHRGFHNDMGTVPEYQPNDQNGDLPLELADVVATVDDDSLSGSDSDTEVEFDSDTNTIESNRTRATPALPPTQRQIAGISTDPELRSNASTASTTPRHHQEQSSDGLGHTHPYDVDMLLPPSLELPLFVELFASLDPQHVLTLLAALFCECRIILTSSSLYRLKAVMSSVVRLMYPFHWQHMFIPLIDRSSADLLLSHTPYIIGVHSSLFESLPLNQSSNKSLNNPVIVELDKNTIKFNAGSFLHLPAKSKNKMYKAIVKFQSSMFLIQATNQPGNQSINHHPSVSSAHPSLSTASTISVQSTTHSHSQSPHSAPSKRPYQALRSLRDGFLSVFLSMLHTYPLYITPSDQPRLSQSSRHASLPSFAVAEFLAAAPPNYSPFLHSLVRTRLFSSFIQLRVTPYVCSLRARIRSQLHDKSLLTWKEMLAADMGSLSNQTVNQSITQCLNQPINLAANPAGAYLFEHVAMHKLYAKKLKLQARSQCCHAQQVVIQRGNKPFKKRYLVLGMLDINVKPAGSPTSNQPASLPRLCIFASKKAYESGKEKPKYERVLEPGIFRVAQPSIDTHEHRFVFELISTIVPGATPSPSHNASVLSAKERVKLSELEAERCETWAIRCESDLARKKWVKLIQSRLMSEQLKNRWETAI